MAPALVARGLSKRYRIGARATPVSLREAITRSVKGAFLPREAPRPSAGEIWAVRDASFTIGKGEVVGIIGRNGAGKSTLLKILAQITTPTAGEVDVFGTLASLLEVGTGFHPELTGRENILLNGSILGMSRATILEHFDEIVAFSDIGKFLDTPVKHYSSGMYVRLAFAVAAHLDADILLLDEVLAVGDMAFQRKCLAKMGKVSEQGRTVVFVSHNMTAIRQLCRRSLLLEDGQIVADGPTPEVIREFNGRLRGSPVDLASRPRLDGDTHTHAVVFTHFRFENASGRETYEFHPGDVVRVRAGYRVNDRVPDLCLYFALMSDTSGETLTSARHVLVDGPLEPGTEGSAVLEFPRLDLEPREYHPYVWFGSKLGQGYDRINYHLTSVPPLLISAKELGRVTEEGYFRISSRLVSAR